MVEGNPVGSRAGVAEIRHPELSDGRRKSNQNNDAILGAWLSILFLLPPLLAIYLCYLRGLDEIY